MQKLRILYVCNEIDPFLQMSSAAELARMLPQGFQSKGHEIRILMPKFGVINDRKNRLHEVVRLSGINIKVGEEDHPLTIKVASIPTAKLQVYFLDNEDFFKRKAVLTDPDSKEFFEDNDERAVFFSKGVIETVKKLGWAPDIIHCHDWMSSLVPFYLKTHYKEDPMFRNTKVIYTVYNTEFEDSFSEGFVEKVGVDNAPTEYINKINEKSINGVHKLGIQLSDLATKGDEVLDSDLEECIVKENSESVYISPNDKDTLINTYQELYLSALN